jgi:ribonuclease T1
MTSRTGVGPRPAGRGSTGTALGVLLTVVVLALGGWFGLDTITADPSSSTSPRAPSSAAAASTDPETGLLWVGVAELPAEARRTLTLIDSGGPFPYSRDGATFGNFERLLPTRPGGFYHEYTVPTPGTASRGARRIVTGEQERLFFYTADHYASFKRIKR